MFKGSIKFEPIVLSKQWKRRNVNVNDITNYFDLFAVNKEGNIEENDVKNT